MVFVSVGLLLAGCGEAPSDKYSRGVGIYPGNPDETFAPELVEDNETYRNVAALKAAWHSSSYDYNLTAQLVTDGLQYRPEWGNSGSGQSHFSCYYRLGLDSHYPWS